MAAKINWHRYGTKLRHCHPMYCSDQQQGDLSHILDVCITNIGAAKIVIACVLFFLVDCHAQDLSLIQLSAVSFNIRVTLHTQERGFVAIKLVSKSNDDVYTSHGYADPCVVQTASLRSVSSSVTDTHVSASVRKCPHVRRSTVRYCTVRRKFINRRYTDYVSSFNPSTVMTTTADNHSTSAANSGVRGRGDGAAPRQTITRSRRQTATRAVTFADHGPSAVDHVHRRCHSPSTVLQPSDYASDYTNSTN